MYSRENAVIPRWPKFDLSKIPAVWAEYPEFAHSWNAISTASPYHEPHLNRVMIKVRKALDGKHEKLARTIDIFVKQESNHYRMHTLFNENLYAEGYGAVREVEKAFAAELFALLTKKSLAFNAAYCAGFETFSLFTCTFFFGKKGAGYLDGAHPAARDLWQWHMAEEYEHRGVCHDAFAAISGNYFIRIYGLLYSYFHLSSYVNRALKVLMAQYRANMTDEERRASIKRERAYNRHFGLYVLPRLLTIMMPFYDPMKARVSDEVQLKVEGALTKYTLMAS